MQGSAKLFFTAAIASVAIFWASCAEQPTSSEDQNYSNWDRYIPNQLSKGGQEISESAPKTEEVEEVKIEVIAIELDTYSIVAGTSKPMFLYGLTDKGTKKKLTQNVIWESSDPAVAAFDQESPHILRSQSQGEVTVMAKYLDLIDSRSITVSPALLVSQEISPTQIFVGTQETLRLTRIYSDGSRTTISQGLSWLSDNPARAKILNTVGQAGKVLGVSSGNLTITATIDGAQVSQMLEVKLMQITSLKIEAPAISLSAATSTPFKVIGTYQNGFTDDITESVEWSSSQADIATVSNTAGSRGIVTGVMGGASVIKATAQGVSDEVEVTVSAGQFVSFRIEPANAIVPLGTQPRFSLIAVTNEDEEVDITDQAFWQTSNNLIASISNDVENSGQFTPFIITNSLQVVATFQGETIVEEVKIVGPALVELKLKSSHSSMACGVGSVSFTAEGTFSDDSVADVTAQVIWSVDQPTRATISNALAEEGVLISTQPGSVLVNASLHVGSTGRTLTATQLFTITQPQLLSYNVEVPDQSIPAGTMMNAKAFGVYTCVTNPAIELTNDVDWSSSNTTNLTVNNVAPKGLILTKNQDLVDQPVQVVITAKKGAIQGQKTVQVRPKEPKSLMLRASAAAQQIFAGSNYLFTTQIVYSDSSIDLVNNLQDFPQYSFAFSTLEPLNITVDAATGAFSAVEENGTVRGRVRMTLPNASVLQADYAFSVRSPCFGGAQGSGNAGPYCWWLADLNEGCLDMCNRIGGQYHAATANWIGTGGTGERCNSVLQVLELSTLSKDNQTSPNGEGLGCSLLSSDGFVATRRYTDVPTSDNAKSPINRRICACRRSPP